MKRAICLVCLGLAGCSGESTGGAETTGSTTTDTGTTTETASESGTTTGTPDGPKRLVVFTRTAGFVHSAIPVARDALSQRAEAEGWEVVLTDDGGFFTADNLAGVSVVAFVLTSDDVLDDAQQAVFEDFIRNGGGFVGVHAATATEQGWEWYGGLTGARFAGHPAAWSGRHTRRPGTCRPSGRGRTSGIPSC
jgi:hypothetical protein